MKKTPKVQVKNAYRLKCVILNLAFEQGVTARGLLPRLREAGAKVNALQVQELIDELVNENRMYSSRTIKQTYYHTTVTQPGSISSISQDLLEKIRSLLSTLGKTETAQFIAARLRQSQEVITKHLEHGTILGLFTASNIGKLRLYRI